jgi:hypothetical protein
MIPFLRSNKSISVASLSFDGLKGLGAAENGALTPAWEDELCDWPSGRL